METHESQPILSVIIPVYGTEQYLAACLDSVLAQSWRALEVILVDDASPDNAPALAEEYAKKDSRIRVIHHPENRGLFRTRVTGLTAMTGQYFAFLDSDDSVTVDYYRLMMQKALQADADLVAGDFVETFENGDIYYPNRIFQQSDLDLSGEEPLRFLLGQGGQDYGCHIIGNKVYHRRLFDRIAPFLQSISTHFTMCEDLLYATLFFGAASHMVTVHGEFYKYYRHAGASTSTRQLTYQKCHKALTDIANVFAIAGEYLAGKGLSFDFRTGLYAWRARLGKGWKKAVDQQCRCTPAQRRELRGMLDALLQGGPAEDDLVDLPLQPVKMDGLRQEELKRAVLSPACRVVSFDVFDTLLLRPFWQPADLFAFMEADVTRMLGCADHVQFGQLRVEAERRARKAAVDQKRSALGEVTLDDIYAELAALCPRLVPHLDAVRQLELDCELRFCTARKKGRELWELAQFAGKTVVCVSDMYLPADFIRRMLEKCGYTGAAGVYVSCEAGVNKSSGQLYRLVQKQLGCQGGEIVHIGDNPAADVQKAREAGWTAFLLPKVTACMQNDVPGFEYGDCYADMFTRNYGMQWNASSMAWFWGMRCLMAAAANRIFDDPFIPVIKQSDFNADPRRIGIWAMGPYLFAIARWLARLCRRDGFAQVNFVARDGWLPMQAFELVKNAYGVTAEANYIYASRKTVLPLLLATPESLYSAPWYYSARDLTPDKLTALLRPACTEAGIAKLRTAMAEQGIDGSRAFGDTAAFERFANLFLDTCLDPDAVQRYKDCVGRYYGPFFQGKSATFDIGYSGRLETVLTSLYGYDITACYLHLNSDMALQRRTDSGMKLETLYDYSPAVTGALREYSISFQGPSCTGFDCSSGTAAPVFEEYRAPFAARYVTTQMQQGALQLVRDLADTFGADLDRLPVRTADACWTMEYFLHYPKYPDADLFGAIPFEDDLGQGHKLTIRDVWQRSRNILQGGGSGYCIPVDYYSMPKLKKWLVWLLVDHWVLKVTVRRKLQDHPRLLGLCTSLYHRLKGRSD